MSYISNPGTSTLEPVLELIFPKPVRICANPVPVPGVTEILEDRYWECPTSVILEPVLEPVLELIFPKPVLVCANPVPVST